MGPLRLRMKRPTGGGVHVTGFRVQKKKLKNKLKH